MLKWCSILELIVDHFFILKAQQQRHERDLALLKLKAEQEALECQRQLEETRNKAAQVLTFAACTGSINLNLYLWSHFSFLLIIYE